MRVISEEEYNIIISKMQEIDTALDLILHEQVDVQQDLEAKILTFYSKIESMFNREGMTKEEEAILNLIKEEFAELFKITTKRHGEVS